MSNILLIAIEHPSFPVAREVLLHKAVGLLARLLIELRSV